jgi:putative transposase
MSVEEETKYLRKETHPMTLYNQLKHSGNPQAAIQTIIYLLDKDSPKQVAEIMGISVRWVYTIRKRFLSSGENLSACLLKRGPKNPMPNRTPLHLEKLVVELAKETNLGPQRLAGMLQRSFAISLSPSTIRNILRRYGLRCQKYRTVNGNRRYKADLDKYRPFEFWQIDAKYVADKTALPPEAYAAIFRNNLPKYQFTAIDVKTRLRFIAYAHNLSFSNGLAFMLLVEAWLRSFGVKQRVFFQTDNGQEFGGKATSRKRKVMQRFIFDRLNVSLLNIPEGKKQANAYVERSHRTDDEEFYAINLSRATSQRPKTRPALSVPILNNRSLCTTLIDVGQVPQTAGYFFCYGPSPAGYLFRRNLFFPLLSQKNHFYARGYSDILGYCHHTVVQRHFTYSHPSPPYQNFPG